MSNRDLTKKKQVLAKGKQFLVPRYRYMFISLYIRYGHAFKKCFCPEIDTS